MKKVIAICTVLCIIISISSCKKSLNDFLEKAPGVDVDENIVFSSKVNVDAFVSTLYEYGMFSILPARQNNAIIANPSNGSTPTQIATDEGKNEATFQFSNKWNTAVITNQDIIGNEDYRYYARWKVIRMANILLERVDELKDPAADDTYKKQVKAQAKFLRALQNFEMLKRYGGFPLVMKRFATADEAKAPRSTFAECVDAIVKDCSEAYPDLEVAYPSAQRGRITKLSTLALKSRTLLYAASPLFNTATPYLSMADAANNKYICYGNNDKNRWKLAADAAMEVLTFAGTSGVSLVDVVANRKPVEPNQTIPPNPAHLTSFLNGNYRVSWERPDNSEIILADKSSSAAGNNFSFPWQHVMPQDMGGFYGGTSVLLNFVKKYEDTLGRVVTWNDAGGSDVQAIYRSLDPRFKQSVGYNQSRWNAAHPTIETYPGGKHNRLNWGGQWMLKPVPEGISNGSVVPFLPLFRLNEFYLNYAEAINEFSSPGASSVAANAEPPNVPTSAYDAVNRIRARSGMPKLPAGLSQDQFRTRVRNERAIELAFEDHRFWDIRRWLIAEEEGVMKGAMYGLKITRVNATTFSYLPYFIETRFFNKNMYLHPFDLNEVLKGDLLQNPGW
jgi:hypothetical protein